MDEDFLLKFCYVNSYKKLEGLQGACLPLHRSLRSLGEGMWGSLVMSKGREDPLHAICHEECNTRERQKGAES